jgi:hypothetical protein
MLLKRCTLSLFAHRQIVTETSDSTEDAKVKGVWSPQQLAANVGYSRQTIVDAINGNSRYPRRLYAQKIGKIWLIPDDHANVFIHWHRVGELLEEPPIPEQLFWGVKEVANAAGVTRIEVERAVGGAESRKGKYSYSYPATLPAQKLGNQWLVSPQDAQKYISEKKERSGRDG